MITAYDIETGSKGQLLDIGLYIGPGCYYTFETWKSLLHFLQNVGLADENETIELWAHNGGKFDSVAFVMDIYHNPELKKYIAEYPTPSLVNGRILFCDIKLEGGRTVKLLDTSAHFNMSLDKMLKGFDVSNKMIIDHSHYSQMEVYKANNPTEYYAYLKADVIGLYEAVQKFRDILSDHFGFHKSLPPSAPGLAKQIYFRKFKPDIDMNFPADSSFEFKFTRAAFGGGRCEFIGSGIKNESGIFENCNYFDVNGYYQKIMLDESFPYKRGHATKKLQYDSDGKLHAAIYHIKYEQKKGAIELLRPFNIQKGTKEAKTSLSGEGYYTHIEIEHILELESDVQIIHGIYYPDTYPLFHSYIKPLYEMRLEAKATNNFALDTVCKLLGNSLFGKFGEKPESNNLHLLSIEEIEILKASFADDPAFKITFLSNEHDDNGCMPCTVTMTRKLYNAFPAISAMITAHARSRLSKALENYADRVLYCDTDSIIIQGDILPQTITCPKTLGLFKAEHINKSMLIWGRKGYCIFKDDGLIEEIKNKGIPKNLLTYDDALALVAGEKIQVDYRTPSSIKSAMRNKSHFANEFINRVRTVQSDISSFDLGKVRLDRQVNFNLSEVYK